jgi:hypothetical protein
MKKLVMEITREHFEDSLRLEANVRTKLRDAIGQIQRRDIGKRVYDMGGFYQVESDEQRDRRNANATIDAEDMYLFASNTGEFHKELMELARQYLETKDAANDVPRHGHHSEWYAFVMDKALPQYRIDTRDRKADITSGAADEAARMLRDHHVRNLDDEAAAHDPARNPKWTAKMGMRIYACKECGARDTISTNHTGTVWSHPCKGSCRTIMNPHTAREVVLPAYRPHRYICEA